MTIEHATLQIARKPWGRADLRPWSGLPNGKAEARSASAVVHAPALSRIIEVRT